MTASVGTARETCWHESNHVGSLLMDNLVPLRVRVDQPSDEQLGAGALDWESHPCNARTARQVLISVLCGPLSQRRLPRVYHWPIDANDPEWQSDGLGSDMRQARVLSDYLALDQSAWSEVLFDVTRRARQRFRRLVVAVNGELESKELLVQPELRELRALALEQGEAP